MIAFLAYLALALALLQGGSGPTTKQPPPLACQHVDNPSNCE